MKKFLFLLIVVAAAGGLFLNNPTSADFEYYVQRHAEQMLLQETGDGPLGRIFSDLGSNVLGSLANEASERQNYFLFSTYTIDLGGEGEQKDQWRFLGIAGQFIELEAPESIRRRGSTD